MVRNGAEDYIREENTSPGKAGAERHKQPAAWNAVLK